MEKLDILIPYYNGEIDLLCRLLVSISNQKNIDFSNIKVFIVDDGSKCEISSHIFNRYPFSIKYKICKHRGISETRNTLLDVSDNNYFMFCDQDDYFYDIYSLYNIINVISIHKPDIVITEIKQEWFDSKNNLQYTSWNNSENNINGTLLHGRVFRKDFIVKNNIRFLSKFDGVEDYTFIALAIYLAKSIRLLPIISYVWSANTRSVSHQEDWDYTSFNKVILSNRFIVDYLLKNNFFTEAYICIEQLLLEIYRKFRDNNISEKYFIKKSIISYYRNFSKKTNKLDDIYMNKLYNQHKNISKVEVYDWFNNLIH